jgi:hypothetical protein
VPSSALDPRRSAWGFCRSTRALIAAFIYALHGAACFRGTRLGLPAELRRYVAVLHRRLEGSFQGDPGNLRATQPFNAARSTRRATSWTACPGRAHASATRPSPRPGRWTTPARPRHPPASSNIIETSWARYGASAAKSAIVARAFDCSALDGHRHAGGPSGSASLKAHKATSTAQGRPRIAQGECPSRRTSILPTPPRPHSLRVGDAQGSKPPNPGLMVFSRPMRPVPFVMRGP